ncbi:MAG: PilZ domain-containing protein [Pseudomonadota bacterium]|nr:PilZ domain-containing protein [Pseudomonadota bacterium]
MQEENKTPTTPILRYQIMTIEELYRCYMPYIKFGGLFVKTKNTDFKLGDTVRLALTVLNEDNRYAVTGKVVWISPKGMGLNKPQGIGLQFDDKLDRLKVFIETQLAGMINSDLPTYTI